MTSIYLGNLSWDLDDEALTEAISEYAQPVSVEIKRNRSGRSSGFALASFETEEDANNVISNMNGVNLNGREVNCREDRGPRERPAKQQKSAPAPAQVNSNSVFVGNLSWDTDEDNLLGAFADFNVVNAAVQRQASGSSKGWALLEFENVDDAAAAVDAMNGVEIDGRTINCREDRGARGGNQRRRGQPRQRRVVEEGEPSPSVFIGNLSWDMTDEGLDELLNEFSVEDASVQTRDDGKSRGYALVRFSNVEEAQRAIDELNEQEVMGRPLLLKFDARA